MRRRTRRKDAPRGRGRRTLLTREDVHDALLQHLANGVPVTQAAHAVGIHPASFYNWWARGEAAAALRDEGKTVADAETIYLDFFDSAERARARGRAKAAGLVMRGAEGGYVVRRTRRTYRDADGRKVMEEDEVFAPVDWRAALAWLERTDRANWGRAAELHVSGAGGGPIEVGVAAYQSMAERLRVNMQRVHGELPPGVIEGEIDRAS